MVINWYGQSCFKIQSGSQSVVFDPFQKSVGLNPPKIEASLVFVTSDNANHNNASTIKGDPFVIDGPGEYEYHGIKAIGVSAYRDKEKDSKKELTTIYRMELESISVVHLGGLGQKKLKDEQVDALGQVDVLLVPVGGGDIIGSADAVEVINQLEPKIAIPMHYKTKGVKEKSLEYSVDDFLKEIGQTGKKPEQKLTIKKKDLPQDRMEVAVLKI